MATGSFDVNLNHTGFGIDQSASIVKRTNGGDLELDGIQGTISSSEITRTVVEKGISTTTTDFAIGRGRPRITNQPDNIDICEGSDAYFEVKARGRGTLTYQWQVDTGSGFTDISDAGVYSGTSTRRLDITGAPYSMNGFRYRVVIRDGQGHPNISNSALLTVNKIPIATATPTTQDECPGVPFQTIVLGTSNDVTGTTFAYSYIKPAGITSQLPLSGPATGDVINGTFTNTKDAPIVVTFTIIPTGPETTHCVGQPITVSVAVNPKPKVLTIPATTIQCDSTNTSIRLSSPSTFTSGLITFKYTVTTTSGNSVTGFTSPTTGIPNNFYITDKLFNQTDHYQVVTYRVVPVSPVGCVDGDAKDVTVTVNPTPRVIPLNDINPAICYGGTSEITLTTPTVMTSGEIKFDYTISFTGVPGDIAGNSAPANDLVPGQKLMFSYTNSAPPSRIDTVNSVLFAIRPKVVNMTTSPGCNAGNIVTPEVKVHPKTIKYNYPLTYESGILPTKTLTCATSAGSSALGALKIILTKGADPYHVVWTGPVGYNKIDSIDITNLNKGTYYVMVSDNLNCVDRSYYGVNANSAKPFISPTVLIPGINLHCPGGEDGEIKVYVQQNGTTYPYFYWVIRNNTDTIGSGVFPNNYNPTDPNTFKVFQSLKAGAYMTSIRDVNGCENSTENPTLLKEPAPIKVEFLKSDYNGYNVSCRGYNNGYALSRATGGSGQFSYQWYAANGVPLTVSTTTELLDSIPAGKYYVFVKDIWGSSAGVDCIKKDSVTLSEPDGMQLTLSELSHNPDGNRNISCNGGNDGFIKLTITGGSGVYNYSWAGPDAFTATTNEILNLKAGIYVASVTDNNNCYLRIMPGSTLPTFTLTEPDALAIATTTSTSNDGAYNINCDGGKTGWINTVVSGGGIGTYKYTWSTTDGSGIIDGLKDQSELTAGTYHLLVTDSNGCTRTKDITLTQPSVFGTHISGSDITCYPPGFNNGKIILTVTGGVVPYSYSWSNGAFTKDISDLTEGLYKVTVTYNSTCMIKDSIRINLPDPLTYTRVLSDYNGYNISCNGLANGFIQVNPTSGLAPFDYNWTSTNGFTGRTQDISDLRAGQYQLTITDDNLCSATETINLTEPGALGMTFSLSSSDAGGYNINCVGDKTGSIVVEPHNQVKTINYLWSDGIFGKTRTNLPAGDYNIIITDANNCNANETVTLTEPDSLKLTFDISPPFCPDKPDGEIRLKEVTGGVMGTDYFYRWSDNSTNRTLSNIPRGNYRVIVRDMNGCTIRDSVTIEPLHETCLVIPNAISPNDDMINDVWNIGMKELYPEMEVKIFNRWGESLWKSQKGYPVPWDGKSNGSALPIDSYHYIIDLHNGSKPLVGNVTIVK
jgi:gliding motility-associated-like protein